MSVIQQLTFVFVNHDLQDNVSVCYHSPEETFDVYPELNIGNESDDSQEKKGDKVGDGGAAAYQLGNTSSRMITEVKQR